MGKKEEDEIIRIAKKMDKMAQKKNGVICLKEWMLVYLTDLAGVDVLASAIVDVNGWWWG